MVPLDPFGGGTFATSSTYAWPTFVTTVVVARPTKQQLRAIARAEQREQSLDACAWLSWLHHTETPTINAIPMTQAVTGTPTRRRTATAVRNFRRP